MLRDPVGLGVGPWMVVVEWMGRTPLSQKDSVGMVGAVGLVIRAGPVGMVEKVGFRVAVGGLGQGEPVSGVLGAVERMEGSQLLVSFNGSPFRKTTPRQRPLSSGGL